MHILYLPERAEICYGWGEALQEALMSWFRKIFSKLFSRDKSHWDGLNYGKPSTAGDEFRKQQDV